MSHTLRIRSFKWIIKLFSLCYLFTIASCQQECKPRTHHKEAAFLLTKVSKHLAWQQKNISFVVEKNANYTDYTHVGSDKLLLKLTRKEGKSAKIQGNGVKILGDGLYEYAIQEHQLGQPIDELLIEVDKDEQKAVFELELVYNEMYLGNSKQVTWENKDINLSIKKLTSKLYDKDNVLSFVIKNKGKDTPEDDSIVLTFTRKDGHKSAIVDKNSRIKAIVGANNEQTGVFELPISNDQFGQEITGLSMIVDEGETSASFDVRLSYKGTKIGKSKTITWMARKVNLYLENVTKELRGDQKTIEFSIGRKGHKPEELEGNLFLRVTRMSNTNAKIQSETPNKAKEPNTFELPLSTTQIGTKEPIKDLNIYVDEGDTQAQFKLQLVYNNMNVGKPVLVNWRTADVKLEFTDVSKDKELIGEGEGKIIKFTVQDKGKDRPKEGKIKLRIIRLKDTNAGIKVDGLENIEPVLPGIFEIPINNYDLGAPIKKLHITTAEGDKKAQFKLQLFYNGMEIGSTKTVTWKAKDVRLELKDVTTHLVGKENTAIHFTVKKKGHYEPDAGKPLILRFTRQEGYNAKIEGIVEGKKIQDKEHGTFELELDSTNIGNRLEGLNIALREGETKAEFKLHLVYDGKVINKSKTLIWEAERVQLEVQGLTDRLRGDFKNINFTIKNKGKDKPEINQLALRLTRMSGYDAEINEIKNTNDEKDRLIIKEDGLYEFEIDINDIGREFDNLVIKPRKGEPKAEFKLQLVYNGIDIGDSRTLIWEEKDIQLQLTQLTKKLRGNAKLISFIIDNKGTDKPEDDKLSIRFTRDKGHKANITRLSGPKSESVNVEASENNSFVFPIGSENIGNTIQNFEIKPRPGEREAKFTLQLVYNGIDMGKPQPVIWVEKEIGLSIQDLTTTLRGHDPESTTIAFKIARKAKHDTEENKLEEGKLAIRFTKKEGQASIKSKVNANSTETSKNSVTFDFPISISQIGNLIKDFTMDATPHEKQAEFKMEIIYDGRPVGNPKYIFWKPKDIKLKLKLKKSTLEGETEQDRVINFSIHNSGKDAPEAGKLFLMLKRKTGLNSSINIKQQPGIDTSRLETTKGDFKYKLDTNKLGMPITDLLIEPVASGNTEFELQLIYDGMKVSNKKTITWKNTFERQQQKREQEERKAKEKKEKEERSAQKKKEKEEKKAKEEKENQEKSAS